VCVFWCLGDAESSDSQRAPVFDTELTNQCLLPGQTALFKCVVSGYPPAEIVWTRRGHPLLDKTRYIGGQILICFISSSLLSINLQKPC